MPTWFTPNASNPTDTAQSDLSVGNVYLHSDSLPNQGGITGTTPATIVWRSPYDGSVNIHGSLWYAFDQGAVPTGTPPRGATWRLRYDGTELASGAVEESDAFNSRHPDFFNVVINVHVNKLLSLELITTTPPGEGDPVGVNLTITPPDFSLSNPSPGTWGATNQLTVTGARPAKRVDFYLGFSAGITSCHGFAGLLGMQQPRFIGSREADGAGTATLSIEIPASFAGAVVFFQAAQEEGSRTSQLVAFTFPPK